MRVPDPRHRDWLVTDQLDATAEEPTYPDEEPGGLDYGLTADEARHVEPLAGALAREEPDPVDPEDVAGDEESWADDDEAAPVGRLVEHRVRRETFVDELDDDGDFSPEEDAVHVAPE